MIVSDATPPTASRAVFALAALPLAALTVWATVLLAGDRSTTFSVTWVADLDLVIAFHIGPMASLLTLVVAGIGALVMVYSAGYFSPEAEGTRRFAITLLAFGLSMVGLVWADSVWTLFVFWELTSITSFLLVGFRNNRAEARAAARRAFLITAGGGLALLAGLLILVDVKGSASLRSLEPLTGTRASVAALLVMIAAATKSAQVPFHVWLPGAMAAPTPVSAYLHSATMVKAGVIVVALTGPAFVDVAVWKSLGLALGGASMLWGAIGALRHVDGKQILAWGTVSQLGLMIVLLSLGEPKATFAALSVVVAHAVFKAALFMVVGEVDVRAGTRDIRELDGLANSMPIAFAAAAVSGASMVGVPPLLGFMAKEAAIEAGLKLKGFEAIAVTALIVFGSVLTAAYTVRFLIGMFGGRSDTPTPVSPRRWPMTLPAVTLTLLSVGGYAAAGTVTTLVRRAVETLDPAAAEFTLLRWPGFTTAFGLSVGIVVVGSALGIALAPRVSSVPAPLGAGLVDRSIDEVVVVARQLTARVQHGSLPVYLVVAIAVAAMAGTPFWFAVDLDALYRWDSAIQPILGLAVVIAGIVTARIGSRLGAALGLGGLGIGVAGLFAAHGAPDLVITQLLVETVVVVGFVIGLGHLTSRFPRAQNRWRLTRLVISIGAGVAVAGALFASGSRPTGQAPREVLVDEAVEVGGGNNVVNVILTDVRGLDTLGEIVVLAVVAIGMLALGAAGGKRSVA